LQIIRSC